MGFDPVGYLMGKEAGGGGGGVTVEALSVTENGVYTAPPGKAFSPVSVDVPSSDPYLYKNCYRLILSKTTGAWTGDPTITIDCTALSTMQNMCDGGGTNPGYKKIVLKNVPTSPIVLGSLFTGHSSSSAFEFVELDGDLIGTGNCSNIISSNRSLKAITGGAFDLSGTTNITSFAKFAYALETVYFVPSTIKVDINFQDAARLTDESLVSAANGLDATASGHSITLDSAPKARCQTLMGTVADGLFTANASGTVTLADFITTVKGWTLA